MTATPQPWFAVRCLFEIDPSSRSDREPRTYEERVTLWHAPNFDATIELAETDAMEYAAILDAKYLGLAQAYRFEGPAKHGVEVFSLMRDSDLDPRAYLNAFFDTGREHHPVPDDQP